MRSRDSPEIQRSEPITADTSPCQSFACDQDAMQKRFILVRRLFLSQNRTLPTPSLSNSLMICGPLY
jgi:hypothetical protein